MAELVIRGGRVIDPAQGLDQRADVLIEKGRIAAVGRVTKRARTLDARGLIVAPGLIDLHVHFREPGNEREETIASGAAAAVAGGFTTVAVMPNTDPPVDDEPSVAFQLRQAEAAGLARVLVVGAISAGRKGERLAEMGQMARAGAVAFSDDGDGVQNPRLMRTALQYAAMLGKPLIAHCEDKALAGGVMHAGLWSVKLGLGGIPAAAEEVMVARDLILAEATAGARLHVTHASTAGTVRLIRDAKARGVPVTADVAIHHLVLTDEAVQSFDTHLKMNPPLRSDADVAALRAALADGTLDCLVSDHAPHAAEKKAVEFKAAPFGVIGLETLLPVLVTRLIEPGILTWPQALAALTCNPARILGLETGTLAAGRPADITLIDPEAEWTIDAAAFRSRSRNCPFHGWKVRGRAAATLVGGAVKFRA
ncbi:MAG TPA: dihydroorotase [Planctomycetota bacterium]|nr:dihydroorotase [Planctomycetota bacterium]HRR81311.1 dihydroorotase [Planctomycetota bacterium]HRT95800.1 dihydroorotase [Planctomycetota bacterium]